MMEQREETVACRKLFYQAAQLDMSGNPRAAMQLYSTPIEVTAVPAWRGNKLSPLEAWRDLVLKKNKEFRQDSYTQEQSAEIELRYLRLVNRFDGRKLKEDLQKAAGVVPLLVPFNPTDFRAPITLGPYSGTDEDGHPWVDEKTRELTMDRMGLMSRRKQQAGPAPAPAPTGPMAPDGTPLPKRGAISPPAKQ